MAIKKSQLYSSLWASCDELRGGMDASQYKDYVLVLLFIKYISDKYAGVPFAPITIPTGSSFKDMVALKWKPTIGDDINKKIIGPIKEANKLSEMPNFNDPEKLGSGDDMVKKLSNLIAIFENPVLDFSKNKAEGDYILGDAYEYLMKHFASESGKSKWQFYTPSEVSRIMAKIIGIGETRNPTPTVYDPTCGSGSLLLKVALETDKNVQLFWQEMDNATAGLARMNMILHNNPTAIIERENTISTPLFIDGSRLKTFDYVVANPPFSFKSWSSGVKDPDSYGRFDLGTPPEKNGDYAFLLHIIHSLKTTGKGACILPHGVLFRGNAEWEIRKNIIERGYIKGIIWLPPNLFYGTGIPACILLLDKENAESRKWIFMIDASKGYIKDGNKNRLRAQDLHKIVDIFQKQTELPKYSRMVSITEIEKNEYNLNIPRYIDSQETEDIQDIEAHLLWGIPNSDIDSLKNYWEVYPTLRTTLFWASKRSGYASLNIAKEEIKNTIFSHPEFTTYAKVMENTFAEWKSNTTKILKSLEVWVKPKEIIGDISESILETFRKTHLIDAYDIYEHLMEYWDEVMQDDLYLIAGNGWIEWAKVHEIFPVKDKNNKTVWGEEHDYVLGKSRYKSDLIPRQLLIDKYFQAEKDALEVLYGMLDVVDMDMQELVEEYSGDGETGYFESFDKVSKTTVTARIKEIKWKPLYKDELEVMQRYIALTEKESEIKKEVKEIEAKLDEKIINKYKTLTEDEIKTLVVDDKWMRNIKSTIKTELSLISQTLTSRVKELSERYEIPLSKISDETTRLSSSVDKHLKDMWFYF